MSSRLFFLFGFVGLAAVFAADTKPAPVPAKPSTVVAAPRAESSVAPGATFDTFRTIGDRNIFNPNRTGRRDRSSEEQAPRVDTITFVGTMDYEKGLFAFFDGSDPAYRKALHVGEAVEQFKVTKITADGVELERAGKPVSLHLAQQLRRPEGGEWSVIGADVVRNEARAAEAARAADSATAPPAIPSDASETLRRLMELRQKQLKQ